MIYSFFLLDNYYFISFTYPKFFSYFLFFQGFIWSGSFFFGTFGRYYFIYFILHILFGLSHLHIGIALTIQQPIPNWFWNSGFVDSELVVEFGKQDICFIGTAFLLESVQGFLIKLDIKPLMQLLEIRTFSLDNVIVRLTKIMNRADKN